MRTLETVASVVIAVFLLLLLPLLFHGAVADKALEAKAETETERFLQGMLKQESVSAGQYDRFVTALMSVGYDGEAVISIGRYETAADGSVHRYDTSWEEIRTALLSEKEYRLQKGSYVTVSVKGKKTSPLSERSSFTKTGYLPEE